MYRKLNRRPITAPDCIECGTESEPTTGQEVYPHRPDLHERIMWICRLCGAYCGSFKNGVPLGNPGGPRTRKARSRAHKAFDPLWQTGAMSRTAAYRWLQEATGLSTEDCHIGKMTEEEALGVEQIVLDFRGIE